MVKQSIHNRLGIERRSATSASRSERWPGYTAMARHLLPAARCLLDRVALDPRAPSRSEAESSALLDVGAGTGEALAEACARGWRPVGLDLSADQLANGRRDGPPQVRADAQRCPFAPESFDAAISNFALIFATDPTAVVEEVRRCLRPGAPFALTAWAPGGWPGACRAILAKELGQPAVEFPTSLGRPEPAKALLGDNGFAAVDIEHRHLRWEFDDIDDAAETLTTVAGGLRALRTALEADGGWGAARRRLVEELARRCHQSDHGTVLDESYIVAYGTRR